MQYIDTGNKFIPYVLFESIIHKNLTQKSEL